jgi:hypothetical protein
MTKTVKDNNPHKVAWIRDASSKLAIPVKVNKVSVKLKNNVAAANLARINLNGVRVRVKLVDATSRQVELVEAKVARAKVVLVLVTRAVNRMNKTGTDKVEHNFRIAQMSELADLPSTLQRIFPFKERFFPFKELNDLK